MFVRTAAAFAASIEVEANGKRANGKSILEILGLGADGGTELAISASGDDAVEAVAELASLVTGLT
jgi:phosphotransferase system HPr (HPr) family protein